MSEWVSKTEIAAHLGYKILIAGLSEAGKTAVKRIFFLRQKTEDVNRLSATLNYERLSITINEVPITIVDLGGQKVFLKRFLSSFSPFIFSSVQIFIFLIDTANRSTRNNALDYFRASLDKLKTYSPNAEIFIFLHKNDLVRNSPNYESIHEQLKEQFQLESNKKILFFRTTIYKPETVTKAFGRIFELVIPKIAKSEFVDNREVGEVEEFHEVGMTTREPAKIVVHQQIQKIQAPSIKPIKTKIAGDPEVLEKLQLIMKESIKSDGGSSHKTVFLGSAASEESVSETLLTHIEPVPKKDSLEIMEEWNQTELIKTPQLSSSDSPPINEIDETTAKESISVEENRELNHLIEFYRISVEEATMIINSGYVDIFEQAATSGIPITLVNDVLLKYLPFIKSSQGEEKVAVLDKERLLTVFFSFLKGILKEDDVFKCLVFAVERPAVSIQNIIENYVTPKPKIKKKDVKISKEEPERKYPEKARLDIPVETESALGVISLPNAQGLGFKIDFSDPDELNLNLSFHLQGPLGQKLLIGSSTVSSEITDDELLYMLGYELNLGGLGIFEDGISSMYFAAKIIHQSIKQLKAKKLSSTKEIPMKISRKGKPSYRAETVEFIIPLEIEVKGDYFLLPDSEEVYFKVEKVKPGRPGFLLSFMQRGFPIGQANVVESITIGQIGKLLKEAMQIPIESEAAISFSSNLINAVIQRLIQLKVNELPAAELKIMSKPVEDETSSDLKYYLSLLEKK